ncbi:hypothetical protein A33Q_0208 [Indibacter alkaliphilus LW1]|uniref:Uncharacterized protein n=1 Tax=Indibacter alkaliphilus (strain CCUG 57479 / KCTC 22604 / LW1) TaxID=1189612 RepID=S2DLR7_INDAL|nr:hypothetical protein A33Q_0208 [Indibacter alkaliphilus LW1]
MITVVFAEDLGEKGFGVFLEYDGNQSNEEISRALAIRDIQ